MAYLYQIKDLNFTYPGETSPALENVSFSIEEGSFTLICGDSGSGKSTLLRWLKERDAEAGFVGQDPETQLICDRVYDELAFGLQQSGGKESVLGEICGYFGLDHLLDRETDSLSGGEKQLVNLAAVTALRPRAILLDEPAASLDPVAGSSLYAMVTRLNRELGMTVILCEHDCQDLLDAADRIIYMEHGRCLSSGFDLSRLRCPLISLSRLLQADPIPLRPGKLRQLINREPHLLRKKTRPQPSVGEALLRLEHVSYRYGKHTPYVLKGLSLSVRKGSILGLAGGNGSGKSTLLKLMAGVCKPFSGRIRGVFGRYLPQDPHKAFLMDLVEEDFRDYLKNTGIPRDRMASYPEYETLYQRYRNRNLYDLSGGEVQRLALYKLLLGEPEILLLDEPTKGLDAGCKEELGAILTALARKGTAIVLATHDMEFMGAFCTEAAFLFDGRIVSSGETGDLLCENEFYTTLTARSLRDQPSLRGALCPDDLYREEGEGKKP